VISDAVWRAQFGRDESILTRQIRLNGEPHDVIGVMPPGFEFPWAGAGIIVPMGRRPGDDERDSHSFYVVGRLRDGATFEESRAEFDAIGRALAATYPANRGETARPTRLQDFGLRRLRPMLGALMGAAILVLVIACVNVANLQLALASARRREWTMRAALGAGLGRLVRQTLLESMTLAAAGGLGGVLVAWAATGAFDALLGSGFLSFWFRGDVRVALDVRVLAFAVATSAACAVVFALAPFAVIRRSMAGSLREDARGATTSHQRTRRVLVAAEVALAIVVLAGAGLLIRSLAGVLRIHPGLDADRVVTLRVSLPQPDPYGPAARATFCADLSRAASAAAHFESVSAVSHLPLSGANAGRGFTIEGRPAPQPNEGPGANYRIVCPDYFSTLRIPFVDGRDIDVSTAADLGGAVILNRATAEKFWPNERAVGRRMKIGGFTSDAPWLTVVGVVENVRHFALDADPLPEIFVPYGQAAWPVMTLVGRTRGEPTADSMLALREVLRGVDPQLPATRMTTMASVVDGSVNWRASFMRLLVVFAAVGLLLAGVGVYAVLAHFVANRRREVGLRMALGATRARVVGLVLRQSMAPVLAGVAIGLVGSVWAARWLVDFLYEVQPGDPPTTLAIAALVVSIGVLASWLPARRAASIDPTVALRDE
jgi:putative ABC transport system permease protein